MKVVEFVTHILDLKRPRNAYLPPARHLCSLSGDYFPGLAIATFGITPAIHMAAANSQESACDRGIA